MSPRRFLHLLLTGLTFLAVALPARAAPPVRPARVDRYGDPLPPGAVARLGTLRWRQTDQVNAVALSPDGRLTAAASCYRRIHLWETATGKLRALLIGHTQNVTALAFSANGKFLASSSWAPREVSQVRLWDVATGQKLWAMKVPERLLGLALSPDGRLLAGGSDLGETYLWDTSTGKRPRSFRDHAVSGEALAFSADGAALAAGARGQGPIVVYDVATGKERVRLPGHSGGTLSVAFAPDGKALLSGGTDHTIRVWGLRTGKELHRLDTGEGVISRAAFAAAGKELVANIGEHALRRWDRATGKELARWSDEGYHIGSVSFSADGRLAALGGINGPHAVRLVDLGTGREIDPFEGHHSPVSSVAFAPDGKTVASSAWMRGDRVILLWDAATGRLVRELHGHKDGVMAVAFSPDGKTLASAGWSQDRTVRLWDTATGKELRRLEGHEAGVCCLAYSADGKTLVSGDSWYGRDGKFDARLRLWDPGTGKTRLILTGHRAPLHCVALSGDGGLLATGSDSPRLWELSGGPPRPRPVGVKYSWAIALSPDASLLACSCNNKGISVREVLSGEEVYRFGAEGTRAYTTWTYTLAFSPDGRVLASGGEDEVVHLWGLASGGELGQLRGHAFGRVKALAFSPDGKRLASGGKNTTVLVWDTVSVLPGAPRPRAALGRKEWERLWEDLGGGAARAQRASWALCAAPGPTTERLKGLLRPASEMGPRLARLIADLDNDSFEPRERASAELERLGEAAVPALRKALNGRPSPEVRRRAQRLLEKLDRGVLSPGLLRALRAVTTLERIGTPQARQVLDALAHGAPEDRLTRQAKAALVRLGLRAGR